MLPLSPRKGFLSFSDLKWDFRYDFTNEQELDENEPILYEILSNGLLIEHKCNLGE